MLNVLWLLLVVAAVLLGGFSHHLKEVTDGAVDGAANAVTLSIGLIGVMSLWLGLMRRAERAGLVQGLARLLQPALRRLFPEIPPGHPALGSIVLNIAANMLGLTNAATPLGLRAMRDLQTLNPHPGTATNAMCTFLAINTSSVQLLPVTAVAILASAGSANPAAIIGTAFVATVCSTTAGITAVKWLEGQRWFKPPVSPVPATNPFAPKDQVPATEPIIPTSGKLDTTAWAILALFAASFAWFFLDLTWHPSPANPLQASTPVRAINALSILAIPFLAAFFPLYAWLRRIPVYEEFVEGAKEGFQVGVRIIPFLVAMLVAIGMFRGAGGVQLLTSLLQPVLNQLGFPAELMPMALVRPLSGTASIAMLSDVVRQFGPDHLLSRTAGTILGSTETTFYVIAIYFGTVAVQRTRHAIPAGLIADAVGILASVLVCRWVFA